MHNEKGRKLPIAGYDFLIRRVLIYERKAIILYRCSYYIIIITINPNSYYESDSLRYHFVAIKYKKVPTSV